MSASTSFTEFLAPMSEDTFFSDYYDKKPVHIKAGEGDEEKFSGLMDFDLLADLLSQTGVWTAETLNLVLDTDRIAPEHYCRTVTRDERPVQQPDLEKVEAYLRKGATLIANDIDGMTRQMSACASMLENALDGKAQSNLYYSSQSRQGFGSHFDTHDVFAIHLQGEKVWRVYEGREPHPIRHAAFGQTIQQSEERKGALLMEAVMRPGDVLYLPRGQYHDALASDAFAIHLAFGVTSVIGIDVISALHEFALSEEIFRENLPLARSGKTALKKKLKALGQKLQSIASSDIFLEQVSAYQQVYRCHRPKMSLPTPVHDRQFTLSGKNISVKTIRGAPVLVGPKGAVPIPEEKVETVSWILKQSKFSENSAISTLPHTASATVRNAIKELLKMGVIKETR